MIDNNKNTNKTTTLKTLFMLSIISMVLVIGGVIPVFAQGIEALDINGDGKFTFWDYLPPTCDMADQIYAQGDSFTPNLNDLYFYLINWPENGNLYKNYEPGQPNNVDWGAIVPTVLHASGVTNTDFRGDWGNPPALLVLGPNPGQYNLITDETNTRIYVQGTDAIDEVDSLGVIVAQCVILRAEKEGQPVRTAQYDDSINIVATGKSYDANNFQKAHLYIVPHGSTTSSSSAGDNIITDLSKNNVLSKAVSIGSDGKFVLPITWIPIIRGEYNIILDMNDDDTYTPGVDLIDYPGEVGITVTGIPTYRTPSATACFLGFEGFNTIQTWWDVLNPVSAIVQVIQHSGVEKIFVFPCRSDIVKFGTNSPLSGFIHGFMVLS